MKAKPKKTKSSPARPKPEELRTGVIDHMAFSATDLADTLALLAARNIAHTCRRQTGSGTWQVFFHDPNGARVELDFAADEAQHAAAARPASSGA